MPSTLHWFFDFHTHSCVEVGRRPDAGGVAAELASAGVTDVTFHAKCHVGFSYYPTRVATPHPKMQGDPLGLMLAACHDHGLRFNAYISFGIDGEAARAHPDWLKHFENGPFTSDDWFAYVCPFTGYTDQLLLPQIDEILSRYDVDGLWFDTMSAWRPCYCATCEADYRRHTGRPLPREAEDADWGAYGAFRRQRGEHVVARVARFIHDRRPGLPVAFNQIGSLPFPARQPQGLNRLSLDFATTGPQSRQASLCAAFGSGAGVEAEVIPTIFNGGWGDWSPAPSQRLQQTAAASWARRCAVSFGDRMHPDVRLTDVSRQAMRVAGDYRRQISQMMPPDSAQAWPDIVVLHSETSHYGDDLRHFARESKERLASLQGIGSLLLDAGANFIVAPEYRLSEVLAHASLLVLPELESLGTEAAAVIEQFVNRGGRVLMIGAKLPHVNGAVWSLPGVSQEVSPLLDHAYLAPGDDAQPWPVLVRSDYHRVQLLDARSAGALIAPVDVRHGQRFGWGIGPPAAAASPWPVLTCRNFASGSGAVWFLALSMASDYFIMGDWRQAEYLRALLRRVLPRPRLQVHSVAGGVEVIGYTDREHAWAVLVNHNGEQLSGAGKWARTWGPQAPQPIDVFIRDPLGRGASRVTFNGRPVEATTTEPGLVSVRTTLDAFFAVVCVSWQPARMEVAAETATAATVRTHH